MADIKTKANKLSPEAFIDKAKNEQTRNDCREILKMMETASGRPATMWGSSIVGFGKYFYKYADGKQGEICMIGFSPRAQNLTLYVGAGMDDETLMAKLGKHKRSKGGCLYIKQLDDIDRGVLRKIIAKSVSEMKKRFPTE